MSAGPAHRRLLLVGGAGPAALSIDACRRAVIQARELELHVTVTVAAADTAEAQAVAEVADAVVAVDLTDIGQRQRFLAGLGEFFGLVFGVRDAMQLTVAEVAHALGAPGNPVDAVRRAVYKDLGRATLAAAGLAQPQVRLCRSAEDARAVLAEGRGPWIVKPRNASASIGVTRIGAPDELGAALSALPEPAGEFLVETYVEGEEFSVEGCFLGGQPVVLACTAKRKLGEGRFVEVGHVLPAPLPSVDEARLIAEAIRALRALGLRFGVFHMEGWLTAGGVVLGEVHTRVGGDWIHRMVEYVRPGLHLFGGVFADALGRPLRPPPELSRQAAAVYLTPPPGVVAEIDGWAGVEAEPWVLTAELTVAPGETVKQCRSSLDRIGVLVVGVPEGSAEDAEQVARQLARSVVFTMAGGARYDGLGDPLSVGLSAELAGGVR